MESLTTNPRVREQPGPKADIALVATDVRLLFRIVAIEDFPVEFPRPIRLAVIDLNYLTNVR